ncbi:MAG: penicillin acylase family protein [Wenzhouxiangellaceae bacterium]|nr:penicillin acylase family protein [Wenzhouxiangellaceae bacterium]
MRLPVSRILTTSILSLIALSVAAWFGGRWWLSWSQMPLEGEVDLAALERPVEVLFDGRGIPRVYAATDADALAALGWLHASERLFQMELLRKVARGEIAEVVGPAGIESDLLHRHYGFARRIELERPTLEAATETLIRAYVDGINTRLTSGQQLPPGFVLLGIEPEPWTIDDVLLLAYYQTWYPTTLVQRLAEAWRDAARAHGPAASDWLETVNDWSVPSVPAGFGAQAMTEASNTWVLAPSRSDSGAALHAADPHLDYTRAPGLWYAVGLHSEQTLDVIGVSAPGVPFIAMGHNGRIAFAFTVAPVDLFEIYTFQRLPGERDRLLGPDGPFALRRITESIAVRDRDQPVTHELLLTPFGPARELDDGRVEVLHWAGFDLPLTPMIENGLALNRAHNFQQFRDAASNLGALSVNWSYSDHAGNIGYVQSTPIPLRQHRIFYTTLDGADPNNHWAGFVPPGQRPFALNPEQGWLANANNHAADDAPWPMPGFYSKLRIRRAADWLERQQRFDADDMRAMQLDQVSERALLWKDWLAERALETGRDALARELREWDGEMRRESVLAGLFARWWQFLPMHLFGDSALDDWRHGRRLLDDWMMQPPAEFALATIDRAEAGRRALDDALRLEPQALGEIQSLTIEHTLARSSVIDVWLGLTRGPIPIGGDAGSLNVTFPAFDERTYRFRARAGASMRFVMDWSDPDSFSLNLTLGQSGHPSSPHFSDQLIDFLDGEAWIVPFSREAVEAGAASRLVLLP